ncbi:MAG: hypothetical protein DRO40_10020 [Thermoprotei archaeon]|nr:MAG: hypothetical protein DRO40_10020 [Thermoprotei archaeon]
METVGKNILDEIRNLSVKLGEAIEKALEEADRLCREEKDRLEGVKKAREFLKEVYDRTISVRLPLNELKAYIEMYDDLHEKVAKEEARKKAIQYRLEHGGCIVVKFVPCGKHCSGCPHGPYKYRVVKIGGKQHWFYLGKA